MAYVITKQPDGDVNLGNLNGEFVSLSDSISDYATGGYALVGGEAGVASPSTINVDLWRILTAVPIGGQGGYSPVWNSTTGKLQMFPNNSLSEANPNTDLSAYTFQLLVLGY